jgi:RNA polymerase sigma factor (sigma-70 family)
MAAVRPDPGASRGETGSASPLGESLEELFLALEGPLLCYALRLLKERDMAEDVVQEAFLRLQSQPSGSVREPRGWLYRTVHNLAIDHVREQSRIVPLHPVGDSGAVDSVRPDDDDPADAQPLPDEQLARWEGIGLVRLGLQNLDGRSREVVRLKFQEGLSYKEIGARTGLTSGHVGYLLHHALKSLADELVRAGLLP